MLDNTLFYKKIDAILNERLPIICKSLNSSLAQQLQESDVFSKFDYSSSKDVGFINSWRIEMLFKQYLFDENGDIFSSLGCVIWIENTPWRDYITLNHGNVYNGTHDCTVEKVNIKKSLLNDDSIINVNLNKIELFLDNVEKLLQNEVSLFNDYYKANGDVIYYGN